MTESYVKSECGGPAGRTQEHLAPGGVSGSHEGPGLLPGGAASHLAPSP